MFSFIIFHIIIKESCSSSCTTFQQKDKCVIAGNKILIQEKKFTFLVSKTNSNHNNPRFVWWIGCCMKFNNFITPCHSTKFRVDVVSITIKCSVHFTLYYYLPWSRLDIISSFSSLVHFLLVRISETF